MPFYEYECPNCGYQDEVLQQISEPPLKKCPNCGKNGLKKLMSAPVFRLKGSGWYETDFKSDNENKRNLVGADKEDAKSEAKPDAKAENKADAKPDAKADTKPDTKAESKPESKVDKSAGTGDGGKRVPTKSRATRPLKRPAKSKPAKAKRVARR
jgi:putative FmdB family regulatory protein